MPQNTNASAFTRLQPLQNSNTGALIEEHKRYWRKYKDDKEANDLSAKANENEFQRKLKKDSFEKYEGLSGLESKGYFTEQVMNYKKENSDYWLDISRKALSGDDDAIALYSQEKEKLQNLIDGSVAVSAQVAKLQKMKADGTFNPIRDKDLADFIEQMGKSNYYLDPKLGKYRIIDKNNPNVLLEIDPKKLTNEFLSSTFHPNIELGTIGTDIASTIKLDDVNGSKSVSDSNKNNAIEKIRQEMKANENLYATYSMSKANPNNKNFDDLSDIELTKLASDFYTDHVFSNFATKDNSLANQSKRADLVSKGLEQDKKRKALLDEDEDEENKSNISVAEDGKGNQLSGNSIKKGASSQPVSTLEEDSKLYNIKGGLSFSSTKGNKNTTRTVTQIIEKEDGTIILVGEEEVVQPTGETTGQGSKKKPVMETVTKNFQIVGDTKINAFLSGAGHGGLGSLMDGLEKAKSTHKNKDGKAKSDEGILD